MSLPALEVGHHRRCSLVQFGTLGHVIHDAAFPQAEHFNEWGAVNIVHIRLVGAGEPSAIGSSEKLLHVSEALRLEGIDVFIVFTAASKDWVQCRQTSGSILFHLEARSGGNKRILRHDLKSILVGFVGELLNDSGLFDELTLFRLHEWGRASVGLGEPRSLLVQAHFDKLMGDLVESKGVSGSGAEGAIVVLVKANVILVCFEPFHRAGRRDDHLVSLRF